MADRLVHPVEPRLSLRRDEFSIWQWNFPGMELMGVRSKGERVARAEESAEASCGNHSTLGRISIYSGTL